jgi:hypothetical protein
MTNKELDELYKLYDEYILYKEEFEKNQELLLKLRFYQKEYDENFGKNERIETSCRYYSSLDKKDIRLYYNKVPTGFNINGARFSYKEFCELIGITKKKVRSLCSKKDKKYNELDAALKKHKGEGHPLFTIKDKLFQIRKSRMEIERQKTLISDAKTKLNDLEEKEHALWNYD